MDYDSNFRRPQNRATKMKWLDGKVSHTSLRASQLGFAGSSRPATASHMQFVPRLYSVRTPQPSIVIRASQSLPTQGVQGLCPSWTMFAPRSRASHAVSILQPRPKFRAPHPRIGQFASHGRVPHVVLTQVVQCLCLSDGPRTRFAPHSRVLYRVRAPQPGLSHVVRDPLPSLIRSLCPVATSHT